MFNHDFNDNILDARDHRPWRMPDRPWAMTQTWHNLLFAHWPVERSQIEPLIPRPFSLDLFGGNAWIGVVPFYMSNVAPRGIPSVPWVSAFAELNVRMYVRIEDRPGVVLLQSRCGQLARGSRSKGLFQPAIPHRCDVCCCGPIRDDSVSQPSSARQCGGISSDLFGYRFIVCR